MKRGRYEGEKIGFHGSFGGIGCCLSAIWCTVCFGGCQGAELPELPWKCRCRSSWIGSRLLELSFGWGSANSGAEDPLLRLSWRSKTLARQIANDRTCRMSFLLERARTCLQNGSRQHNLWNRSFFNSTRKAFLLEGLSFFVLTVLPTWFKWCLNPCVCHQAADFMRNPIWYQVRREASGERGGVFSPFQGLSSSHLQDRRQFESFDWSDIGFIRVKAV